MLLVGLRFCWRPLVLMCAFAFYSSWLPVLRLRTPLPPQSQLTPPQPHAQHAGFSQLAAGGRLMRQDAWQQQAAQRLSSRSTALAQREEECRGWPNGHPGMRAGEAPLTRLACHAGYKGGGDSVERGDASSLDGWRPSPDLERCCKSAQYSFPPVTSSRYVTLPVNLNGQTFR